MSSKLNLKSLLIGILLGTAIFVPDMYAQQDQPQAVTSNQRLRIPIQQAATPLITDEARRLPVYTDRIVALNNPVPAEVVAEPQAEPQQSIVNQQVRIVEMRGDRATPKMVDLRNYSPPSDAGSIIMKAGERPEYYRRNIRDINTGNVIEVSGMALPEQHICKLTDGGQVSLGILVETLENLRFSEPNRTYEGSFTVTLIDSNDKSSRKELLNPVFVELVSATGKIFHPGQMQIRFTNFPSTEVRVIDPSKASPVPIKVKTTFNPEGYETALIKQAHLEFSTDAKPLQGFGIEKIPVHITCQGNMVQDSILVTIDTQKGKVKPSTFYLRKGGSVEVILRSRWMGRESLKATSHDGIMEAYREFEYIFPYQFLIFAILGGLIGALVKRMMRKGPQKWARAIPLGILVGFIVALLYLVIGIPLFPNLKIEPETHEVLVLAIAFLGALFWEAIYKSLAKMVG